MCFAKLVITKSLLTINNMAAKKFTFIFRRGEELLGQDDLIQLVDVIRHGPIPVSYKAAHSNNRYDSVQIFTTTEICHQLVHTATKAVWASVRRAVKAARRNGDTAVSEAQERFGIRRKFLTPAQREVLGKRVHDCAVKLPDDTARLNWMEARGAGLNLPNTSSGLAHIWVSEGGRVVHHYGETYREVIDRAMGYESKPQMPGGTKRSKRSA